MAKHNGANNSDTGDDLRSRFLALARLFEPKRAPEFDKIRLGQDYDGGYILFGDFSGIKTAFSFGINNDVSWDLAIVERSILVHQFDHTIARSPVEHSLLSFHKTRIAETDGEDSACIDTLVKNFLTNSPYAIMKMDIEGDEWPALAAASPESLLRFTQIICEFHDFSRANDPAWYARAFKVMTKLKAAFEVVHVHANNGRPFVDIAGIAFPDVLDVTFASRGRYRFVETDETFPTKLDQPNDSSAPDHYLGPFKFG